MIKHDDEVLSSDRAAARLRRVGVGARVETTQKAITNGVVVRKTYGTVAGWGRHRWDVQVRKDGNKAATAYHVSFWKPLAEKG